MASPMAGKYLGLLAGFLASLMFLMFQGGKVAFMVFIMVSIFMIYLLLGRWSGINKTQGTRELLNMGMNGEMEAGTALKVRMSFKVPGFWPIPYVIVKDRLSKGKKEEHSFELSFVPDWKRSGEINYVSKPLYRGFYEFKDTECLTEDVFGLFRYQGRLKLNRNIRVFPKTANIREWREFARLTKGAYYHSANTKALRETTQINGVRDYVYGDRISRIHWNASARTGKWKSKEFERESLPKLLIVLDGSSLSYQNKKDAFELSVSVAASLIKFGGRNDLSQGLLSISGETKYFEPKRDIVHQREMMKHLISVEADGKNDTLKVLQDHYVVLDKHCFFIFISTQKEAFQKQFYAWFMQHQMRGCFIWIDHLSGESAKGNATAMKEWKSYRIQHLEELPKILGGRAI